LVGEVKKRERNFLISGERRIEKRKLKSKPPAGGHSKDRDGFWSDLIITIIIGLYCLGGFSHILI